jgi:hypothetical protein
VTSLTTRGRVAVVVGFVVSAGLCAGAAVALVKASDHTTTGTLPQVHPTLIFPSSSPTPTPSPTASPTPVASPTAAPVPTASASASPTRSATATARPTRRATHQPTAVPVAVGPAVDAQLVPVEGQPGVVRLLVHATSDDGAVTLTSVDWKDGVVTKNASGTACDAPSGSDCKDFSLTHTYGPGTYDITVVVSNAVSSTTVVLRTQVG